MNWNLILCKRSKSLHFSTEKTREKKTKQNKTKGAKEHDTRKRFFPHVIYESILICSGAVAVIKHGLSYVLCFVNERFHYNSFFNYDERFDTLLATN